MLPSVLGQNNRNVRRSGPHQRKLDCCLLPNANLSNLSEELTRFMILHLLCLVNQPRVRDGFAHFQLALLVCLLLSRRHRALSNKRPRVETIRAKTVGRHIYKPQHHRIDQTPTPMYVRRSIDHGGRSLLAGWCLSGSSAYNRSRMYGQRTGKNSRRGNHPIIPMLTCASLEPVAHSLPFMLPTGVEPHSSIHCAFRASILSRFGNLKLLTWTHGQVKGKKRRERVGPKPV